MDSGNTKIRPGDWKSELMNLIRLKAGRASHRGDIKKISDRSAATRELILFACFNQIRALGFKIQTIYSLRPKHIDALVESWVKEEISAGTIQNRLSALRTLCDWMGKGGMVKPTNGYSLVVDPARLKRIVVADADKSWSAAGIDIDRVIRLAGFIDGHVAMQLKVIDAFGLRREEAIQFKPYRVDEGNQLRIRDGTKGHRERLIQIENDYQRQVLMEAKNLVESKSDSIGTQSRSLKQNINRFNYVMRKLGITKSELGVTAHGLRHERLNDIFEETAGVPSPVRQAAADTNGNGIQIGDPELWQQARQKVSNVAGHARLSISSAYTGSARSVKKPGKPRLDWTSWKSACGNAYSEVHVTVIDNKKGATS